MTSLALLCSTLLAVQSATVFAAEESTATVEKKSDEAKTEENGKSSDEKEQPSTKEADKKSDDDKSAESTATKKEESKPAEKEEKAEGSAESNGKASSETKRAKVRLALLTLKDSLPETGGQMGLFSEIGLDLREAINRLEKASKDKSIAGLVLDIQNPSIGQAKVEELRAAIARFRKTGKKVYAQLESRDAGRLPGGVRL